MVSVGEDRCAELSQDTESLSGMRAYQCPLEGRQLGATGHPPPSDRDTC
jgi:hypothetical protein